MEWRHHRQRHCKQCSSLIKATDLVADYDTQHHGYPMRCLDQIPQINMGHPVICATCWCGSKEGAA